MMGSVEVVRSHGSSDIPMVEAHAVRAITQGNMITPHLNILRELLMLTLQITLLRYLPAEKLNMLRQYKGIETIQYQSVTSSALDAVNIITRSTGNNVKANNSYPVEQVVPLAIHSTFHRTQMMLHGWVNAGRTLSTSQLLGAALVQRRGIRRSRSTGLSPAAFFPTEMDVLSPKMHSRLPYQNKISKP